MKNLHFSRHSERQMKWRKIVASKVKEVIKGPDSILDSAKGRKNATKTIGKRLLQETFREEADRIVIITAIAKPR